MLVLKLFHWRTGASRLVRQIWLQGDTSEDWGTPLEFYEPVAETDDHYYHVHLESHLHDAALAPCRALAH